MLQTENHTSTSSLSFYRPDVLPEAKPTASKGPSTYYIMQKDNFNTLPPPYTQPFHSSLDFVWDNLGALVPEKTFIHSHPLWSSIIPYLLPQYITIHGILAVQFMCQTVFTSISVQVFLGLSISWSGTLHFILHTHDCQYLPFFNSQLMHCLSYHFSQNPIKSFLQINKVKIELLSFNSKILLHLS